MAGVEELCKSATNCTCLRSRDSLGPQDGAWPSSCGREEGKEGKLRDDKAECEPTDVGLQRYHFFSHQYDTDTNWEMGFILFSAFYNK